jgi:hypothetical protein
MRGDMRQWHAAADADGDEGDDGQRGAEFGECLVSCPQCRSAVSEFSCLKLLNAIIATRGRDVCRELGKRKDLEKKKANKPIFRACKR